MKKTYKILFFIVAATMCLLFAAFVVPNALQSAVAAADGNDVTQTTPTYVQISEQEQEIAGAHAPEEPMPTGDEAEHFVEQAPVAPAEESMTSDEPDEITEAAQPTAEYTESVGETAVAKRADETYAQYFRRVWLDKLVQCAGVLLSALLAVMLTVRRVREAHAVLVANGRSLAESQLRLDDSGRQFNRDAMAYQAAVEALRGEIESVIEAQRRLGDAQRQVQISLAGITDALRIAFCNDKELVNNGFARTIADALGVQYEKQS